LLLYFKADISMNIGVTVITHDTYSLRLV